MLWPACPFRCHPNASPTTGNSWSVTSKLQQWCMPQEIWKHWPEVLPMHRPRDQGIIETQWVQRDQTRSCSHTTGRGACLRGPRGPQTARSCSCLVLDVLADEQCFHVSWCHRPAAMAVMVRASCCWSEWPTSSISSSLDCRTCTAASCAELSDCSSSALWRFSRPCRTTPIA